MITELYLKNWKSFDHARLYIDPLSILIGTNSSGKSNVLDALVFLQHMTKSVDLTTAFESFAPALRGGIEWAVLKPYDNFTLGLSFTAKVSLH